MARFKPSLFSTAMVLLIPTVTKKLGVNQKVFPTIAEALEDGMQINGSFRTYGGTERDINGLYSIDDTAIVETWYRPDITSECRIAVIGSGAVYEILGKPEDIELRHQFIRMKVRAFEGGA